MQNEYDDLLKNKQYYIYVTGIQESFLPKGSLLKTGSL